MEAPVPSGKQRIDSSCFGVRGRPRSLGVWEVQAFLADGSGAAFRPEALATADHQRTPRVQPLRVPALPVGRTARRDGYRAELGPRPLW
eukprot:COSAG01_NODE_8670_length_2702_cov_34.146370_3_plen_89_part_00